MCFIRRVTLHIISSKNTTSNAGCNHKKSVAVFQVHCPMLLEDLTR